MKSFQLQNLELKFFRNIMRSVIHLTKVGERQNEKKGGTGREAKQEREMGDAEGNSTEGKTRRKQGNEKNEKER